MTQLAKNLITIGTGATAFAGTTAGIAVTVTKNKQSQSTPSTVTTNQVKTSQPQVKVVSTTDHSNEYQGFHKADTYEETMAKDAQLKTSITNSLIKGLLNDVKEDNIKSKINDLWQMISSGQVAVSNDKQMKIAVWWDNYSIAIDEDRAEAYGMLLSAYKDAFTPDIKDYTPELAVQMEPLPQHISVPQLIYS